MSIEQRRRGDGVAPKERPWLGMRRSGGDEVTPTELQTPDARRFYRQVISPGLSP